MTKDVRWKQRFENFDRAFLFLKSATERKEYDPLQAAGLVQSFEFTFELAWKTLKDYLGLLGTVTVAPRDTIKESFSANLIDDGHLWIQMLDKRNELSHVYNDMQAKQAIKIICNDYFPGISQVHEKLKSLL